MDVLEFIWHTIKDHRPRCKFIPDPGKPTAHWYPTEKQSTGTKIGTSLAVIPDRMRRTVYGVHCVVGTTLRKGFGWRGRLCTLTVTQLSANHPVRISPRLRSTSTYTWMTSRSALTSAGILRSSLFLLKSLTRPILSVTLLVTTLMAIRVRAPVHTRLTQRVVLT